MKVIRLLENGSNYEQFIKELPKKLYDKFQQFFEELCDGMDTGRIAIWQEELKEYNLFFNFDSVPKANNIFYLKNRLNNQNVVYSTDADIFDQSYAIAYLNNFEIVLIFIEQFVDTKEIHVYRLEIFEKPSDAFVYENDVHDLNSFFDTKYVHDLVFKDFNQALLFSINLAQYYGANNFDSEPLVFKNSKKYHKWLRKQLNLKH